MRAERQDAVDSPRLWVILSKAPGRGRGWQASRSTGRGEGNQSWLSTPPAGPGKAERCSEIKPGLKLDLPGSELAVNGDVVRTRR